jgi:hypothetical protein
MELEPKEGWYIDDRWVRITSIKVVEVTAFGKNIYITDTLDAIIKDESHNVYFDRKEAISAALAHWGSKIEEIQKIVDLCEDYEGPTYLQGMSKIIDYRDGIAEYSSELV